MDSMQTKVDKFIERTGLDLALLDEIADHQMKHKMEKEFVQNFGECSLNEIINVASYCKHKYVDSITREPNLLSAEPLPVKKKATKKKRGKKR